MLASIWSRREARTGGLGDCSADFCNDLRRDEEIKSSIHLVHTSSKQASYRRKRVTQLRSLVSQSIHECPSPFNSIRPSYYALYPMFDSFHQSQSRSSLESISSLTMRSEALSVIFITAFLMPKECTMGKNQRSDDGKWEEETEESRNKILGRVWEGSQTIPGFSSGRQSSRAIGNTEEKLAETRKGQLSSHSGYIGCWDKEKTKSRRKFLWSWGKDQSSKIKCKGMWIQATFTASLVSSDKTKRSEESDVLYSRENNPCTGGVPGTSSRCNILSVLGKSVLQSIRRGHVETGCKWLGGWEFPYKAGRSCFPG